MSVSLERFTSADYQLTGDLVEVPHLGGVTNGVLTNQGIKSTHQLLGHFLSLKRDEAAFIKFLESTGTPASHRKGLANAIKKRVLDCGVKVNVSVPAVVDGKAVSSKLTNQQMIEIADRKFTQKIKDDFPGVGFGDAGVKNLKANGIETTDQLFGELLKHIDGPQKTEHMVNFWKRLGELGVAHGWKTTVVEALKTKLDVGIDNCAKSRMAKIPESPATGDATRTRGATGGGGTIRQPQFDTPTPPSTSSFSVPKMAVVFLVLALGYKMLFSGGSTNALPKPEDGEWM